MTSLLTTGAGDGKAMSIGNPLTMSSLDISRLARKRHDSVKRSIVALADDGILTLPQIVETSFLDSKGKTQHTTEYRLEERDSYVVAAKVCPKFMAAVVDEWIELRGGISRHGGSEKIEGASALALLDMADRTRVETERTRDLIIHEGGNTRGAIIKSIREIAGNPIAALKQYLDDRFVALHKRDTHFHRALQAFGQQQSEVIALARQALQPDAMIASDWVAVGGIYALAGISGPIPRQKSLSARATASLVAFCIETNRQMDMRGINFTGKVHLYRATAVRAWLKDRGRALIDQHIAKHSTQTVIQFPAQNNGEGK